MEYGDFDLSSFLKAKRCPQTNKTIWKQILSAVAYCHANNIMHGDLKPANFVCAGNVFKMIDFGFAKSIPEGTIFIPATQ